MNKIIEKDELVNLSHDELIELTKDHAVDFHLYNGKITQLSFNDLKGFDSERSIFYTNTGIKIELKNVNSLEVYS